MTPIPKSGKKPLRKAKSASQGHLKKKLDAVFSKYIRQKHSMGGFCYCYTCGKRMEIKESQCGHFVSRGYLSTRWDEENTRPQCVGCNIWGNGKPLDFEEKLKKEIGVSKVEKLKMKRHKILKVSSLWYEEQIEHYQNLLDQLLATR